MKKFKQLIINPGSTSTKIAVFDDEKCIYTETLRHSSEDIGRFPRIIDQFAYRQTLVLDALQKAAIDPGELDSVVGRGGLLRPISGGTYFVNEKMIADLRGESRGLHASNLGGLLAKAIADDLQIPAYIVDPVSVDEMEAVARISGMPDNPRESLFHALNQKAVARKAAADLRKSYQESNLIVAHLGGGISVGAHTGGQVIDVNNAIPGEGPFSPERSGGVPVGNLVRLCYSGRYSEAEIKKKLVGQGGMVAYLGTNNAVEVEKRVAQGDQEAELVYQAMAYQVAKEIGAASTVLKGRVDAIIITGGIAHSQMLVNWITDRVDFIAPVMVYPGEEEMEALAAGGLRVLMGTEKPKSY